MTDIQAAVGASQMNRLTEYVARRREIARRYDDLLAKLPLTLPWQHPDGKSAYHLYVVRLQLAERSQVTHRAVFEAMRAKGVLLNVHYIPVHTQPFFEKMGFRLGDYPEAESYYLDALSLPMYPTLTEDQQDFVVAALGEAIGQ
jgi:dTDP-4-amino-4,6-dideoxygalactose transaminase